MIELKNLQVKYEDFVAVDQINLKIPSGSFFTFLGPSGCGKTTVLRAIAGLEEVSQGQVFLNDQDITQIPAELRNIGMVFQSYALFPSMSVYDNIAYGLTIEKKDAESVKKRVHEVARLVDLDLRTLERNVSQLSGGQQQRVAIARTLAKKPELVLFDEPLSNLDARLRKQLRMELKRIQKETGLTAIYVTHDQEEALEISDYIAVFNIGQVEQVGTPQDVYNHSASEFVCSFLGDANLLTPKFLEKIKQQTALAFNAHQKHYIRDERIGIEDKGRIELDDSYVSVEAEIEAIYFQGPMIKYKVKVEDQFLNILTRNQSESIGEVGKECRIVIRPSDILSYDEERDKEWI